MGLAGVEDAEGEASDGVVNGKDKHENKGGKTEAEEEFFPELFGGCFHNEVFDEFDDILMMGVEGFGWGFDRIIIT